MQAALTILPLRIWRWVLKEHPSRPMDLIRMASVPALIRSGSDKFESALSSLINVAIETVTGNLMGNQRYLTIAYLGVKFLHILTAGSQLALYYYIFDLPTLLFDYYLTRSDWRSTGVFPRVTYCDYEVANVVHSQIRSVQCVLPQNMLYEKLFFGLWIWFCFLCIISFYNFFVSLFYFLRPKSKTALIKKCLHGDETVGASNDHFDSSEGVENIYSFAEDLSPDGAFMLRCLRKRITPSFMSQVTRCLLSGWTSQQKPLQNGNCTDYDKV